MAQAPATDVKELDAPASWTASASQPPIPTQARRGQHRKMSLETAQASPSAAQTNVSPSTPAEPSLDVLEASAVDFSPNIRLGPGTAKLVGDGPAYTYSPEQIRALGTTAGIPLLIVSPSDTRYLSPSLSQTNLAALVKLADVTISLWMPEAFNVGTRERLGVAMNIVTNDYSTTPSREFGPLPQTAVRADGPVAKTTDPVIQPTNGAILVIPGEANTTDFARVFSGINFSSKLVDPQMMKELQLFYAAHEASHAAALRKNNDPSEATAERGAHQFFKDHPEDFPILSKRRDADAFMNGSRALFNLVAPDKDTHLSIALDSMDSSAPLLTQAAATTSQQKVLETIALAMERSGLRKSTLHNAAGVAMTRVLDPGFGDIYISPSSGLTDHKFDLTADKTGVLKKYLDREHVTDLKGKEALDLLKDFSLKARDLYLPDNLANKNDIQAAKHFFAAHHVDLKDVARIVETAHPSVAANQLKSSILDMRTDQLLKTMSPDGPLPIGALTPGLINPANPNFARIIETARLLNDRGRFDGDPAQKRYVENLMKGADLLLDSETLLKARVEVSQKADQMAPIVASPKPQARLAFSP